MYNVFALILYTYESCYLINNKQEMNTDILILLGTKLKDLFTTSHKRFNYINKS